MLENLTYQEHNQINLSLEDTFYAESTLIATSNMLNYTTLSQLTP